MRTGRKTMLAAAGGIVAIVAAATGVGVTMAGGGDDNETPITGDALERASAAALAHTGGGTVTGTESGDEEGAYEIEVTLDDGSETDVHLDADFNVLGAEPEGSDEDEGADDDGE